MTYYLKLLSVLYFIGGMLHVLDLLDLRLMFSEMSLTWQIWIIYLAVFDLLAAVGLWRQKIWGEFLFIFISVSQLVAYGGFFTETFGTQEPLVIFHITSLILYAFFKRNSILARIRRQDAEVS